MQAFSPVSSRISPSVPTSFARPRPGGLRQVHTRLGLAVRAFSRFVADDRDRWVPVVCAAGFTLIMWVDWLAA